MFSERVQNLLNGAMTFLIFASAVWSIIDRLFNHARTAKYYGLWLPVAFILIDAFVLSMAVFRVYRVLRQQRMIFIH